METTIVYWYNVGIMENRMETTIVYWYNIGIMENRMETTIMGQSLGNIVHIPLAVFRSCVVQFVLPVKLAACIITTFRLSSLVSRVFASLDIWLLQEELPYG